MMIGITGRAAWTCFGRGVEPLRMALRDGTRHFAPVELEHLAPFKEDPWFKTKRAMQIPAPAQPDERRTWPMDLAVQTALDAVADAALEGRHAPSRIAVCSGTSHGSNHGLLSYLRQRSRGEAPDPTLIADLPSMVASRIAQAVGAQGPCLTFNTACSSGLNAIGQGLKLLQRGRADCVVAGAHDTFSLLSYAGFTSLQSLDPRGCRPFDAGRSGLSLGDGAGYVVLERAQLGRGLQVVGYGYLGEAYHPTAPDPEGSGIDEAMRMAIAPDVHPADLAFVAAHGTGTPANDEAELRAITRVAAAANVTEPVDVVSLKSQLGHGLGAAGAMQAVATIVCMESGMTPANITLEEPVEHDRELLRLSSQPQTRRIRLALCNALGFGGSVAALAFRDHGDR